MQLLVVAVASATVLLGSALVAAATSKLLLPTPQRTLLTEFAEASPAKALAVALLPYLEVTLAGMLVPDASRRYAAIGCCILMATFAAVLLRRRLAGSTLPCGCFGSSENASLVQLVRVGGLAAAAIIVAALGSRQLDAPLLALALLAGGGALCCSISIAEARRLARLVTRCGAMPAASILDVELRFTGGAVSSLRAWLRGAPALLLLVDPLCGPCRALLSSLALKPAIRESLRLLVVSRGPVAENEAMASEFQIDTIAVQREGELALALGLAATPAAVVLAADGRIDGRPALGRVAVETLVAARGGKHRR